MTLLHQQLHSTSGGRTPQQQQDAVQGHHQMLSTLWVRKARSAHDITAQAQRKLRTVVSEFFPPPPPPPPLGVDHISRLPEELLIAILCYVDGSSIAACNQTCRGLRLAISHSMRLQYSVALFTCGMLDGPRRDANDTMQLRRLQAHDNAWRQLAWTDARALEHLSGSFHPTAVSGSTIAFIPFGPGPVSGFKLLVQQFASVLRGTDMRRWELQFQLMSVHDTLMDVSQDLLLLLEPDSLSNYTTNYHVYSLSTGRPLEMPEGRTISGGASGLCGDYIGATAYSPSDKSTHLVLWNWKTGERKVDAHPHYFSNDPSNQLVVIEMASRRRSPVPARHHHHHHQPLVFAWENWGEGRALCTKRSDIERRLPNLSRVCGLRHVTRRPVRVRPEEEGAPAVFRITDFHPGRVARIAQRLWRGCAVVHVEVPLPREMWSVDPVLISTSICQDALIVFERTDYDVGGLRRVFVCSF
ncbi:hypothetical protein EI94DRAFT_1723945 [Lactarius quietus]|nr:hypothetical protein EI94DRAFT_1723945 [Lactarius quietus]